MSTDAASTVIDRFLRLTAAYRPHLTADLIVMFAMSIPYRLKPHLGLRLDAPEAFRAACHEATQAVGDAQFDSNARVWLYDQDGVLRAFSRDGLPKLPPQDARRFCDWLADGYCLHLDPFFARIAWRDALLWILLKPDAVRAIPPGEHEIAHNFARTFHAAWKDSAYGDAVDSIYSEPGDDLDAFLQTKFHMFFSDDDLEDEDDPMEHSPLDWINDIREGNLLRRQLAPSRDDDRTVAALETMLRAYLEHGKAGPRLTALGETRFDEFRVNALFDWDRNAAS